MAQEALRTHGFPYPLGATLGIPSGRTLRSTSPSFPAHDETVLEPGMDLAVETPHYGVSLRPFCIKDMVPTTGAGNDDFNTLPYDLVEP